MRSWPGSTNARGGIYKYALDNLPKDKARGVYQSFMLFEKQHGDREAIEDVVLGKRRVQYEADVRANPTNYDVWFDYADGGVQRRRGEDAGGVRARHRVRASREREEVLAAVHLPVDQLRAVRGAGGAGRGERTREVYRECLKLVPHKTFSFSKIWIMAATFEIRQKRLDAARKILGMAIGLAPKDKIFKAYIDVEMQLGNVDRCRALYQKALENAPHNCQSWVKFADLERDLGETERARAVYELAIAQSVLDMPELLWKSYIDFEIAEGERERTRRLYERLLDRTQHVKVWMSFAQFEAAPMATTALQGEEETEGEDAEAATARRDAAAAAAEAAEGGGSRRGRRRSRRSRRRRVQARVTIVARVAAGREGGTRDAARGVARARGGDGG